MNDISDKEYKKLQKRVLYEDNHLLIVNKAPSDIVQGDITGDTPLSELYKGYLKRKYNKPGNVFLGVTHRLDRPTSGAVIFAKTGKVLPRINKMLQERGVSKFYWAIVSVAPNPKSGKLTHYLTRNSKKNKSFASDTEKSNSKKAELNYEIINSSDRYFLLNIELLTGRHHQIRAQLSAIGSPIKGDLKYGFKTSNKDASISLHARKLTFIHPVKKERITVIAPTPDDKLWKFFESKQ